MLIFSSLTFVFERDVASETEFHTMLDAYWWALITMTTVYLNDRFVFVFGFYLRLYYFVLF